MTDYKKVTRKSRDPEVKTKGIIIERKARDATDTSILNDQIHKFNRISSEKIEYGDIGGHAKGLKRVGAGSFITGAMTKKEASNCLEFTNWVVDNRWMLDNKEVR